LHPHPSGFRGIGSMLAAGSTFDIRCCLSSHVRARTVAAAPLMAGRRVAVAGAAAAAGGGNAGATRRAPKQRECDGGSHASQHEANEGPLSGQGTHFSGAKQGGRGRGRRGGRSARPERGSGGASGGGALAPAATETQMREGAWRLFGVKVLADEDPGKVGQARGMPWLRLTGAAVSQPRGLVVWPDWRRVEGSYMPGSLSGGCRKRLRGSAAAKGAAGCGAPGLRGWQAVPAWRTRAIATKMLPRPRPTPAPRRRTIWVCMTR
jgi:hypothetical protein